MGGFTSLADLVIESETVTIGEKKLKVYGLGLSHILRISREHFQVVSDLFDRAKAGTLPQDVGQIAAVVADEASSLACLIIACGARAPDQTGKASELPFSVQVDALEKIIRLTLVAEGGLGKLMEIVTGALAEMGKATAPKA